MDMDEDLPQVGDQEPRTHALKGIFLRAIDVWKGTIHVCPSRGGARQSVLCDACDDLQYIPEQGSYGSCAIISIVSLVLKTPCLMDYLRITNPDAHYALKQIELNPDGSFVRVRSKTTSVLFATVRLEDLFQKF